MKTFDQVKKSIEETLTEKYDNSHPTIRIIKIGWEENHCSIGLLIKINDVFDERCISQNIPEPDWVREYPLKKIISYLETCIRNYRDFILLCRASISKEDFICLLDPSDHHIHSEHLILLLESMNISVHRT